MRKNFSEEARVAAREAYENEYETRWYQLGDEYQDELIQAAQAKIDVDTAQWKPTKPTDEETKAEIRKVLSIVAAENEIIDQARIDNSVEEMFQIIKKSFG